MFQNQKVFRDKTKRGDKFAQITYVRRCRSSISDALIYSPSLGSTTLYYHADHLGGANVLTDATGFKKELIEYEPFGQESRHEKYGSSEEVAWYYFTGKKTDDESGLIYFGARYYDPKLGRFITPDTIVPYPTNPQAFNRYSYAGNNPVSYLENGNWWFIPFIIAVIKGAAIGAAVGAATAAITGGDIGKGALFGAIGGAAFAGLSSAFTSFAKFAITGTTNMSLIGNAATTINILGAAVAGAGAEEDRRRCPEIN